jgi:glycosyltransferase involved in cell wall biosynthesis
MKVAFVEPHLKIFGGIRRIIELSNRLTDLGVDVTIYHPEGSPCDWLECRAKVRRSEQLLEERQEVVIYNDPNRQDVGLVRDVAAALKVFFVLELYETRLLTGIQPELLLPRHDRTRLVRKSLRAGYEIWTNASWLTEFLERRMGLASTLLLGGVNHEMFHAGHRTLEPGVIRVLCSGDARPRKGTAVIERAFEIVRDRHPELTLRLSTYHSKGIPQSGMAEVYGASDIFVEASDQAGWNNPVAEAMACGTATVCTDIGGVRDFAQDNETALLAPVGDVAAIAAQIERLALDAELRERLSTAAISKMKKFQWDDSARRMKETIEQTLSAAGAPRG